MRLFIAFDLPEIAKERLLAVSSELRPGLPPARWVAKAAFHVTLAFLGEVEAAAVAPLAQALSERLEQEGGFQAHFAQVGTFPVSGPVRVVWVGLEPAARCARLAELARDAVVSVALSFDAKAFRSHVTLARCDPPWPAHLRTDLARLSANSVVGPAGFPVVCDRVTLFSSRLQPGGPTYHVEAEFLLRA